MVLCRNDTPTITYFNKQGENRMEFFASVFIKTYNLLGEGIYWNEKEKKLYWVDIEGKLLQCASVSDKVIEQWSMPLRVGTAAPMKDGRVILALEDGIYSFDRASSNLVKLASNDEYPLTRFNDGKCDPAGRFWAGTMSFHDEPNGSFSCYWPDGTLLKVRTNVTCSNGLGWSPDYTKMYYIDTPTQKLFVYEYDFETGAISNCTPLINFDKKYGFPDGMTVDSQGRLWIAKWKGASVEGYSPNGELLHTIHVPCSYITSVAFGEGATMYITSAKQDDDSPDAGCIFSVDLSSIDASSPAAYTFG